MKIRFILNGIEFECDGFISIYEVIEFIRNLTHNNCGRVQVISVTIEEIVKVF
jgi:predicted nucleic-acid-binding protein